MKPHFLTRYNAASFILTFSFVSFMFFTWRLLRCTVIVSLRNVNLSRKWIVVSKWCGWSDLWTLTSWRKGAVPRQIKAGDRHLQLLLRVISAENKLWLERTRCSFQKTQRYISIECSSNYFNTFIFFSLRAFIIDSFIYQVIYLPNILFIIIYDIKYF